MSGLRAGTRTATLIVEGEHVNFTKGLRMLSPRFYPFSTVDSVVTRSAGGGTTTLNPPALEVATGTIGGALCNFRAIIIENIVNDVPLGDSWWGWAYHVRGKIGPGIGTGMGPVGMGIGHPYDDNIGASRPPWPDPSSTTWCRLYYSRADDEWVLESTPGDGVTATAQETWPNPFTEIFFPQFAELVYDPFARAVYAVIGGTERMRISDTASLPRFDSAGVVALNYTPMANVFVESNDVNGASAQCFFSNFLCWNPDMDDTEGAEMW